MEQTQRDRVKRHLLEHGSITRDYAVYTMRPGINRLSERIRELRAGGMQISEGEHVPGTSDTRYTLLNRPAKKVAVYGPTGVIFVPEELAKAQGMEILD